MKSPFFQRKRPDAPSSPAVEESTSEPEIDIRQPRECIYASFQDNPGPCPRCGGPLYRSKQVYLIDTRRGRQMTDSFIASGDFGWFCLRCPTVVISPEEVSAYLNCGLPHWDVGDEFRVVGIVDLDAVPKDKWDIPLGEEENPIPVVEFVQYSYGTGSVPPGSVLPRPPSAPGTRKKKGKRRKKKHRR